MGWRERWSKIVYRCLYPSNFHLDTLSGTAHIYLSFCQWPWTCVFKMNAMWFIANIFSSYWPRLTVDDAKGRAEWRRVFHKGLENKPGRVRARKLNTKGTFSLVDSDIDGTRIRILAASNEKNWKYRRRRVKVVCNK